MPGAFVVNLGDLMAAWTNDRWRSTLHRVVVPDDDTGVRISIAFFHQPDFDAPAAVRDAARALLRWRPPTMRQRSRAATSGSSCASTSGRRSCSAWT